MKAVLEVPLSEDLTEFCSFLWANEIPHRVTEQGHMQILWVAPYISAEAIGRLYQMWKRGERLENIRIEHQRVTGGRGGNASTFGRIPVVLILIGLSVLATLLLISGSEYQVMGWLGFANFSIQGDQVHYDDLSEMLASGQLWRIWTPMFLHFSVLHILFNLLWVWVIGRLVEWRQGSVRLLMLVLFSGALSNLTQYLVSGPLFGGMSGVVFALLSYTWLWDRLSARPVFGLPPALMGFMLFWLALGYTGVLEKMGLGTIANTAHLSGLICGLVFALLTRVIHPSPRKG